VSETLTFAVRHDYGALAGDGIVIPITLSVGDHSVRLLPKLDTGAAFCIFERAYGEALGLAIETGVRVPVSPAKGDPFDVFGHNVRIECFEWEYDAMVYFAAEPEFKRNVLGRRGWMPQFRVAVVEHDAVLHLSHYDDE